MASTINQDEIILKEKIHRNLLYVGIFSIVMLFAGLTSAYIVRQADGQWLRFTMPTMFWVSSGLILISSATMHWALVSVRKNKTDMLNIALWTSFLLGIGFCASQFYGWGELIDSGIYFAGKSANPSGSFMYAISGLHLAHIFSGLIYMSFVGIKAMAGKYSALSHAGIRHCAIYWHFLDGLWIYLFIFLLFMQ